jgi:hypothetical protein
MPVVIPVDYVPSASENTMRSGTIRSGYMSLARLRQRYKMLDFADCARNLCLYLRARGDQNNFLDKYRVAERALYPNFGAVGLNRDDNLSAVLYYWMAANDPSSDIPASVADRCESIVRALYESQRGNNALDSEDHTVNSGVINFADNGEKCDNTICKWGVINKFAECFVAMHPDVVLVTSLKDSILDLVRGFIAEYLYAQGKSFDFLKSPTLALDDEAVLPVTVKTTIKAKIIEIFGRAGDTYEGMLTSTELTYLNEVLGMYLESLDYATCKDAAAIKELIDDAHTQLRGARFARLMRHGRVAALLTDPHVGTDFDFELIAGVIASIVPQPSNSSYVHGDFGFRTLTFNADTQQVDASDAGLFVQWVQDLYDTATVAYGRYSQEQLTRAMQPQPATLSRGEVQETRKLRRIAVGARPNA